MKRKPSRRTFLKAAGFSAIAFTAGCDRFRMPLEHVIPSIKQPVETIPGRAAWYASLCQGCEAGCGILVKVRDGRPIKIEGNPQHPLSRGGLCAIGQAQVLSLYDSLKIRTPLINGLGAEWNEVDSFVSDALHKLISRGQSAHILTNTITSPSTSALIKRFLSPYPGGKHFVYDPLSAGAILASHEQTHGTRVLPQYRFDRADVILSLDADFLGNWISPVEHACTYRLNRDPSGEAPKMSLHIQLESRMSLTGSKADERYFVSPRHMQSTAAKIAEAVASKTGRLPGSVFSGIAQGSALSGVIIDTITSTLLNAKGRSLVISGINDPRLQTIINALNYMLGNYNSTINVHAPSFQKSGNDSSMPELINELETGRVGLLIIQGANPVYDHPLAEPFAEALGKAGLVIRVSDHIDETAEKSSIVLPEPHPLESWNDAEPVSGIVTLGQPVISPLRKTRSLRENLSAWIGEAATDWQILRKVWQDQVYPRSKERTLLFDAFWNQSVHDGFVSLPPAAIHVNFNPAALNQLKTENPINDNEMVLLLYPKTAMLDGRHAHNAWLQELPDPITKIAWDNYISLSPSDARRMNVNQGDLVSVSKDGKSIALPAYIQPGQNDGVAAVALGYGRKGTDRFALTGRHWMFGKSSVEKDKLVGANAAALLSIVDGHVLYHTTVTLAKSGGHRELASAQKHHTLAILEEVGLSGSHPSSIIEETTFAAFLKNPHSGKAHEPTGASLWPDDHSYKDSPVWGMAIDLTACTGCSACVIGCQAENNIPVVGRDEFARSRTMQWLRIDRYYTGIHEQTRVVHQPMTCHHCHNAPCETVCPALATVHSEEGLNQQVYNRCIGTRYCANNCPYKVRRFNWFDYPREDRLENMQLNPDVTVRSRGIMEKCSFCIQRISLAKSEALQKGAALKDGDVLPACMQSCPSSAILFGNMNDPDSNIAKALKDPRYYTVLSELNLNPAVGYLRLIRNREENYV